MNFYPWIVLVHVTGVLLFFIAHGAPAMVGLRLRNERDPARVLALPVGLPHQREQHQADHSQQPEQRIDQRGAIASD